MAKPYLSFRSRRLISIIVTSLALLVFAGLVWLEQSRLGRASILTGSTLLTCIVLLSLIGVRRRLPILPLGTVSTWTQIHLYTGLFTAGVYWLHVPALLASGRFEGFLSIVFLAVTASGVYGIFASRTLPRKLTAVEGQHRFDRVGWHRNQLAITAGGLLETMQEPSGVRVLGSFYENYLQPFFESRPSFAYVMMPNGVRRRRLLSGLQQLDRYLEDEGRNAAGQFAALVRRRDDLDYQYALQLRLRLWLVVHSLLSVALLLGGIVHAVIALRFMG